MKDESLRLCLLSALGALLISLATLQLDKLWVILVLGNFFMLAMQAAVFMALCVYWCCPPDPVEVGTGLCRENPGVTV